MATCDEFPELFFPDDNGNFPWDYPGWGMNDEEKHSTNEAKKAYQRYLKLTEEKNLFILKAVSSFHLKNEVKTSLRKSFFQATFSINQHCSIYESCIKKYFGKSVQVTFKFVFDMIHKKTNCDVFNLLLYVKSRKSLIALLNDNQIQQFNGQKEDDSIEVIIENFQSSVCLDSEKLLAQYVKVNTF